MSVVCLTTVFKPVGRYSRARLMDIVTTDKAQQRLARMPQPDHVASLEVTAVPPNALEQMETDFSAAVAAAAAADVKVNTVSAPVLATTTETMAQPNLQKAAALSSSTSSPRVPHRKLPMPWRSVTEADIKADEERKRKADHIKAEDEERKRAERVRAEALATAKRRKSRAAEREKWTN
jgi:hypothetical protein